LACDITDNRNPVGDLFHGLNGKVNGLVAFYDILRDLHGYFLGLQGIHGILLYAGCDLFH
jgi:hypothetical protein